MMDYPKRLKAAHLEAVVSGKSLQVYHQTPDELNLLQINGQLENPKKAWPASVGSDLGGNCCCFSPTTGKFFAIGHSDSPVISIYDPREGLLLGRFVSKSTGVGGIQDLTFSKCERYLYFTFTSGQIVYLNTLAMSAGGTAPSEVSSTRMAHRAQINHITLSPNGKFLATSSNDGTVLIWDASAPAAEKKPPTVTPTEDLPSPAAFASPLDPNLSPDAKAIDAIAGTGSPPGATSPLSPGGSTLFKRESYAKRPRPFRHLEGHTNRVLMSVFSSDSNSLYSIAVGEWMLRGWDVVKGKPNREPLRISCASYLTSISISPDDRVIAIGSRDKSIRFVDVVKWQTMDRRNLKDAHNAPIKALRFAPSFEQLCGTAAAEAAAKDRRQMDSLATSYFLFSFCDDGRLKIWNVNKGHTVFNEPFPYDLPKALSLSPSGNVISFLLGRKAKCLFFALSYGAKTISSTGNHGPLFYPNSWKHPEGKKIVKFTFSSDLSILRVQEEGLEGKVTSISLKKVTVKPVDDHEVLFLPAATPFGFPKAAFPPINNNKKLLKPMTAEDKSLSAYSAYGSAVGGEDSMVVAEEEEEKASPTLKVPRALTSHGGSRRRSTSGLPRIVKASETKSMSTDALLEAVAKAAADVEKGAKTTDPLSTKSSSSSSGGNEDSFTRFMKEFDKKAKARDLAVIGGGGSDKKQNRAPSHHARNENDDDDYDQRSRVVLPAQKAFGFR